MTQRSVTIIGAGLAGLSAGCYAQMNGYRSRIFEHHTVPGGGVPPSLYSGQHAVQILCKRDGRRFVTSAP